MHLPTTRLVPGSTTLPSYSTIPIPQAADVGGSRARQKGLTLSGVSAVAFALATLLVRMLGDQGYSPVQIMLWRGIVQTIGSLLACATLRVQPFNWQLGWKRFRWVLMRAVFGGTGHLLYYTALAHMPMGIATVLFFTNPIFTALFAAWLLAEPFDNRLRTLMLLSLVGVALAVPLSPVALFTTPIAWALSPLAGAAAVAVAYVSIRKAGRAVHPMIHVVFFGIIGTLGAAVAIWMLDEHWPIPSGTSEWLMVVGVGTCAFLAQFLMNWGLQLTSAAPVVMMRNSDIVICFLMDALIYQTLPSLWGAIGATIITVCVALMCR
ncbi:hypothetical protein GGF46_005458 [Coemansia sp. RSA 552]|nr:hypothetical protein GGF46_005458 [Coemansia sp. RSA 552]